jgi:hypothetical protein
MLKPVKIAKKPVYEGLRAGRPHAIILANMTLSLRFAVVTGWLHRNKLAMFLIALVCFAVFAQFANAQLGPIDSAKTVIYLFLAVLGYVYTVIAFALGKLIVVLIGMIIIPILGYNDFGSSFIISIGWPLVRDVMNMFVILILILIAIKTILGIGGGAQAAQQNILKLFLAVVAMNFSRTICVLIIDFGQVVMMTFVNALQDIAAGNFVGLFQLNSFLGTTLGLPDFDTDALSGGFDAISYLGSAYLMLVLMAIVLGVICIIAVVFIYRIVILWILTILSPMAFFLMGVPLEGAKGYASEWRKKFVGAVTLGPILTFFLWLALATAGQGSLVATEGFPTAGTEDSVGLLNDIFETDKMLSLFIGILLLFVGLQASSSAANALGDFSGKAVKSGQDFVKWAAAAPARGTYAVGREGVRRTEAQGIKMLGIKPGAISGAGKGIQRGAGSLIATAGKIPLIGGAVKGGARIVASGGSALERAMDSQMEERIKNAGDSIGKEGKEQKMAEYEVWGGADFDTAIQDLSSNEQMKHKVRAANWLKPDSKERADFGKRLEKQGLDASAVQSRLELMDKNMMTATKEDLADLYGGSDAGKLAEYKAKAANPHLLTKEDGSWDEDTARDVTSDERFSTRFLSAGAVSHGGFQQILKSTVDPKVTKDRKTHWEQIESGKGGGVVQRAYHGEGSDKSFIRGEMPATTLAQIQPADRPAAIAAWESESTAKAEIAGRGMASGRVSVDAANLKPADMEGSVPGSLDSTKVKNLAKALVSAGGRAKGLEGMDATIRSNVVAELNTMKAAPGAGESEVKEIDKVLVRVQSSTATPGAPATGTDPTSHMSGYGADGNFNRGTTGGDRSERIVREVIKERPSDIHRFDSRVGATSNDTSRIIVKESGTDGPDKFLKAFKKATQEGNIQQAQAAKLANATLRKALVAELHPIATELATLSRKRATTTGLNDKETKRYNALDKQATELNARAQSARYTDRLMT